MFGRRRLRGSSVLRDVQAQNSDQPNIYDQPDVTTVPGDTGSPNVLPGSLYGGHYAEVRNVIEIPFDDSLDSSFPLECFFQMPVGTTKVNSAKVWIQQKPFRMYSNAASSTGSGGQHTHAVVTGNDSTGSSAHTTDNQGIHTHLDGDGVTTTGSSTVHSHNVNSHDHAHGGHFVGISQDSPTHSHTVTTSLTPGIFESGPSGTFAVQVSDDGTLIGYGAAITSGQTSTPAGGLSLTGLTKASGDKRIKITATGLQRVQVLVVLDLLIQVVLP